ncbi:MAG: methyltransferase [Spirochaetaceae bacterium]|jgi:SAM-dependent methyltransferase|nr:methyltransferase [Spirochaetaceae bacterium]
MIFNRYYASFVPGMQNVVEAVVRERLSDVRIEKLLDGAILFASRCTYDKLNFFCFNNIFAVISVIENPPVNDSSRNTSGTILEAHMRRACRSGPHQVIAENTKNIRSFRIVCSRENTLAAVDEQVRRDTERYIAAQSGMAPHRSRPDTEFWFLCRREGFSVFMKRLTRRGSFEKTLHPGELPPPLAYLLCRLSGPKPGDVAADPFCGYGAIPAERLRRFPVSRFYASDRDGGAVEYARKKLAGDAGGRCIFRQADVYSLPSLLPPESLDAIITDPPWGLYTDIKGPGPAQRSGGPTARVPVPPIPIQRFYEDIVEIFAELLKPGGRAVVLTARRPELADAAARTGKFEIGDAIPILLSGKKASVFVLRKKPRPIRC